MKVDYKKLWIMLIEKGISKAQLRELCHISPATLTKLNKNEIVSLVVIIRICLALNCEISDIVEIVRT